MTEGEQAEEGVESGCSRSGAPPLQARFISFVPYRKVTRRTRHGGRRSSRNGLFGPSYVDDYSEG